MKRLRSFLLSLAVLLSCNKPKGSSGDPPLADAPPLTDNRPLAATVSTAKFDCSSLDTGIYWFGKGDVAQKATSSTRSSFYDRTKPTVIYVHGWQSNSHAIGRRATFNYSKTDPIYGIKVDAADAWIDAGWNVGIYYWNQISDEISPITVEDKIWGTNKINWKNCAGTSILVEGEPDSVVDLFYADYKNALKDYAGPGIRLAGHSAGNQLVTRLTEKLAFSATDQNIVPKRVALLDPWWAVTSFVNTRPALLRASILAMKTKGIIFEWYRTSNVNDNKGSSGNEELIPIIGRTEVEPDYYSSINVVSRHIAAPFIYFLSFQNPAPSGCVAPCTDIAPSAATSDARMLEIMNKASVYRQAGGRETPVTSDNTFELKTK